MTSLLLYALFPRVKRKELTSFTINANGMGSRGNGMMNYIYLFKKIYLYYGVIAEDI